LTRQDLFGGVPLGIALGLFAGKQVGILSMVACARLFKWAELPQGTTWGQIYGVSVLCGIGFTMSLFIGSLAFEHGNFDLMSGVKVGVLAGSAVSAMVGLLILHFALPATNAGVNEEANPGGTGSSMGAASTPWRD